MLNISCRSIVTLGLCLTFSFVSKAQEDCKLKRTENGITVYSCKSQNSAINGIKAEFNVHTTLEEYKEFLLNIQQYDKWQYRVKRVQLHKEISPTEKIFEVDVESPWPTSDRDLIMHLVMTDIDSTGGITVEITCLPDYLPEKENFVRVPMSHSVLTVTPVSENLMKASYYLEADPGGEIPVWLINLVSTTGPLETFGKVKEFLDR